MAETRDYCRYKLQRNTTLTIMIWFVRFELNLIILFLLKAYNYN